MKRIGLLFFIFYLTTLSTTGFPFQRDTIENGLIVLSYEDHKLPIVEMRVVIKVGSVFEPKGKEGLANLVLKSLLRGTKKRSVLKIYEEIEEVGARIGEWAGYDYSQISVSFLNKDLDLVLDILYDILTNPVFPDTEIDKLKSEIISGILRDEGTPDYILSQEFYKLLFQNTPYSHLTVGTKESVRQLKREDVVNFYNSYYVPNNIFFVVVGDFKREELISKIRNLFAQIPQRNIPQLQFPEVSKVANKRAKIITKEDVNQAYIMLGHFGIRETDKDVLPVRVMNFIFGAGALTSRLGKEIREKRGLAYDVGSYFDRRLFSGAFVCEMQTEVKNTQKALDIILEELQKMREIGATSEELKRAKRFYTGNFPLTFDSYSEKAGLLTSIEFYNLGDDYLLRFKERIERLSLDKINQMAKEYLNPENLLLVIVGNVQEEDLSLKDWEVIRD